jgi:hypothetical protein
MSVALYFVSRRGAEVAESAERHKLLRSKFSARSATSAPLRETNSALRVGASK